MSTSPGILDTLSQRLAAVQHVTHSTKEESEWTEGSESDDDAGETELDSTKLVILMVPVLIPMLAKMLGRYVTINLMRRFFRSS
ncbi:uncharacterized protein SPPG_09565 [Spizellomyces punctatus DAOM BR117]|uniref:Uncharacterized protein n=1 Tax=Spizellomyces punctatus (strain DAOM BR117) TaxID=645134 RepID=A0A0L0H363_SPIPD|nr:uncharacterized protein SPPG_09565 [Spizellomyces punctatus DAOM BR117]KNC95905.1 hypothetical protein SPPG_09565 [Spizellomyces punctatus DAOM BR117]|eukprot:XP_016603945.1 hypothetical protein SPPG_09565 [Spizellomyces punctatus DAOM BR117]